MHNNYFLRALARFSMRFTAYCIFLPIMAILFPAVFLGDIIRKAFYRFIDW